MFLCSSGYFLTNNKNLPRQPQISQIMLDSPHHPRDEVTKKPRKSLILNELRGGAGAWPVTRWYTTSYEDFILANDFERLPSGNAQSGQLAPDPRRRSVSRSRKPSPRLQTFLGSPTHGKTLGKSCSPDLGVLPDKRIRILGFVLL